MLMTKLKKGCTFLCMNHQYKHKHHTSDSGRTTGLNYYVHFLWELILHMRVSCY